MNRKFKKHSGRVFGSRLTATLSISLVLLLFAIMLTVGYFAHDLSKTAKENISITVVLSDQISDSDLASFKRRLDLAEWAGTYEYIDKETALKELTEELGENPENLLGYNPLPATFEVRMVPQFADIAEIKAIENSLTALKYVQEVVYREDLIQLVNKNLLSIGQILLGIAVILTLISFMLIRNTVRLMIYAQRFLIHTMCLVGARRSFIRRPFVRQNARCGVISAFLAIGLFHLSLIGLNHVFPGIQTMMSTQLYLLLFAILVGLGLLISVVATVFSVNRFLKMSSDELYYV